MQRKPPNKALTPEQLRNADAFIEGAEETPSRPSDPDVAHAAIPDAAAGAEAAAASPAREPERGAIEPNKDRQGDARPGLAGEAPGRAGDALDRVGESLESLDQVGGPRLTGSGEVGEVRRASAHGAPDDAPWLHANVRDDVMKMISLRLPEPLYLKLKYVSEVSGVSMNAIVTESVANTLDDYIQRRREQVELLGPHVLRPR